MTEEYKLVTFSDGKRKTYEKIIKEKPREKNKTCQDPLTIKRTGL